MTIHTIPPVFDENSKILVLGSFPSPKSREHGFFYGHPQNRFWQVLSEVLCEPLPSSNEEKRALLLRRGIAMWDVLHACEIRGASDSSIKNPKPNDFSEIFARSHIRCVFTTGRTAEKLYTRLCLPSTGIKAVYLPSTSAANGVRFDLPRLVAEYRMISDVLNDKDCKST